MNNQNFRVYVDIIKAVPKDDGRVYVSGIATDESDDISGEVVSAALNPQSIKYLNDFGKFNYDHHDDVIGDVTGVGFITPETAKEKYGLDTVGSSLEIEGWIQPLSADPENRDLRELHRLVKSGAKIGYSLHSHGRRGTVELKDGTMKNIAIPTFIPQVAITPQPVNTNAVCIVKSLSKLLSGEYNAALKDVGDGEEVEPLFIFPSVAKRIDKAITTTGEVATPGATSGDALKQQDLNGVGVAEKQADVKEKSRKCCGHELPEGAGFCPSCGKKYRSFAQQTRIIKALLGGIYEVQKSVPHKGLTPKKVPVRGKSKTYTATRYVRDSDMKQDKKPSGKRLVGHGLANRLQKIGSVQDSKISKLTAMHAADFDNSTFVNKAERPDIKDDYSVYIDPSNQSYYLFAVNGHGHRILMPLDMDKARDIVIRH